MGGFDILYPDMNQQFKIPMAKFVTLVWVSTGNGFPDEHVSEFAWDREFPQFVD
jgi:hypothetical protein